MSIQGIRKELNELRKSTSYEKPIEILLKSDPKTLTDYELFRVINHYDPEIKTIEDLNNDILEKMATGE
ncbi:MAG TPA: hypothetical protein PLI46_13645 [Methanosarcina thermophila]|nr:hypothetical protein [Methanosarcina thermophila]